MTKESFYEEMKATLIAQKPEEMERIRRISAAVTGPAASRERL